jgi:hypothetical protein
MQRNPLVLIAALGSLALLPACSKPDAGSAAATAQSTADAAALAEKAAQLAQREADVAAREATLAAQKAAEAAAAAVPEKAAEPVKSASKPIVKPPVANKPVASKPVVASAPTVAAPQVLVVPVGTPLSLALTSALSTKTAVAGDAVRARVTSDVLVDGRVAIAAGTTVAGQVIQVISGSNRIGGLPTLGLRFERLELPGGRDLPLSGEITQTGKSDTARDTVKIVGGAAAGAILGHQIKGGDKGKVLGGLLGGAIGAVAAQKTGTEVELAEGTALSLALAAPVEITR